LKLILLKPSMRLEGDWSQVMLIMYLALGKTEKAQRIEEKARQAANDVEQSLLDAARKALGSKAAVLDMDTLDPPAAEACEVLRALASRLARGNVNEAAMEALGRLGALDERYAVLVQFFRLEADPGAPSGPYELRSSAASTLMQAALLSCKTGKVIWKGEQFIRYKALKAKDGGFHKALTLLYQDFDIK
jgi:hypothetical protein